MAISQQERELVLEMKSQGRSPSEIVGAVGRLRAGYAEQTLATNSLDLVQQTESKGTDALSNLKTGFSNAVETVNRGTDDISKVNQRTNPISKKFGQFTQGLKTAGGAITDLSAGALRALPGGDTVADTFNKAVGKVGEGAQAIDEATGQVISGTAKAGFEALPESVQTGISDTAKGVVGALGVTAPITGVGGVATGATRAATATTRGLGTAGRSVLDGAGRVRVGVSNIGSGTGKAAGVAQIGRETLEKVQRGVEKAGSILDEKAAKAERIRTISSESELRAIKSGVPEQNIEFLKQVDTPTLSRFKDLMRTADEFETNKFSRNQPKNLAGEDFINAFKAVDQRRKDIGAQIGTETQKLGKSRRIDLQPKIQNFQNTLEELGVRITKTENKDGKKVTRFNYEDTGFTPSQRKAIDDLYRIMIEGGTRKTPNAVWLKDGLFSKFRREKLKDDVSDLNYTDANGNLQNLFTDARNVYSDTLSDINPKIRQLNAQYREYAGINQQVRKDFLKTESGKFADEGLELLDFSDTAGLSLQRIFSNADSGVRNGRLVDLVMRKATENGYTGANPLYTAQFARDLEDLFELAPKNSFAGRTAQGIDIADGRGATARALDKVQELGSATTQQQREAILKMIQELLGE